ncbi:hypothetical protein CH370_09660 [Leptospira kmetyi]|uniref:restriction endonuclease n=1 Tax=Leptospira kmetyi TaxID=408139 RepID=UPI000C2A2152|nr:restriction endonuclease [Leptospira kmetyi]PJZ41697.1 hypothetical protein CH370_09660 [Leptospira kmetyi]TGL69750.1 restriction endonuclease [Leptospira kmetyi]
MSIPDYQTIMLPYLKQISDGKEYNVREVINSLYKYFKLTEEDLNTFQPSNGKIRVMDNRSHWAKKYLLEAGLLESTKKAHVKITKDGLELLKRNPLEIKVRDLLQYPKYISFKNSYQNKEESSEETESQISEIVDLYTPEENIENSYRTLHNLLINELNSKLKSVNPYFFEQIVLDLLIKMGYGGSRSESGLRTKSSNDEGIDGTIFEDRLGLDIIYIQAKRWKEDSTVGRPEIQKFVGALYGQGAKKGIFITTTKFSKEAIEFARTSNDFKIVLIDGNKLSELMIDFDVGVSVSKNYTIKKIDSDYFDENE